MTGQRRGNIATRERTRPADLPAAELTNAGLSPVRCQAGGRARRAPPAAPGPGTGSDTSIDISSGTGTDEGTAMRYQVRQKMFSIGDDFWITDDQGNRVFLVDGKAMSLRERLEIKDSDGEVRATVRKRLLSVRDTMEVERDGEVVATVAKALFSPLRHRSTIDLADGRQLEAAGNLVGMEFDITFGGRVLARISRAWFRVRDTYGVEVAPGEDDALLLAVAVCLDRIHHDEEEERRRF
jgi:uncharacterized protein YxjI